MKVCKRIVSVEKGTADTAVLWTLRRLCLDVSRKATAINYWSMCILNVLYDDMSEFVESINWLYLAEFYCLNYDFVIYGLIKS